MNGFPVFIKECPPGAYEMTVDITPQMTDKNGKMRIGELARQMQTITEAHFDRDAGIKNEELQKLGISWVISWSDIQLIRLPKAGEKVLLRIWPGKNKAIMYTRKYAMYTLEGEPLMATASLFLLMDQHTRTAAAQPEQMKDLTPVILEGEPKPPKMKQVMPATYAGQKQRVVQPEEIDYNGHLNNSHYLDWTEELKDTVFKQKAETKEIWIQYSKELKEGEEVTLNYLLEDQTMYLSGIHDGTEAFQVVLRT